MAEDTGFKRHFSPESARYLGERIRAVHPGFDVGGYVARVGARVGPLELKDRVLVMAEGLRAELPEHYPEALDAVRACMSALTDEDKRYADGFYLMALTRFVEEFGVDHPEASLAAMPELTRHHTCEFAVRPFVAAHYEAAMALMRSCALDPDPHVRRFASEGIRPRLPWAARLPEFVADPSPVLEVLETLRSDPAKYVRTSVANNLNDISRDHPGTVLDLAGRWVRESPTPETAWTVKHALRTLVKQGDQRALALLGATGGEHVLAKGAAVYPQVLDLGGTLRVRVDLVNTDERPHTVIVDYVVHHVRANGSRSPKVFKWTKTELCAGERRTLERKHPVRVISTRSYYPGEHLVEVQVNGLVKASASFVLRH